MNGVDSPGGKAISCATKMAVGSLAAGSVDPSASSRVGDITNSWLGSIDRTEKDLDSLPD